jgi:iron donor protein CyaY
MDQKEFPRLADGSLAVVAKWLDNFDPDEVDCNIADGVITMEFPDGDRFILNRQVAATQLWLAASAGAWHYDWNESTQTWVDSKDRHSLYDRLAELISAKIGRRVEFDG